MTRSISKDDNNETISRQERECQLAKRLVRADIKDMIPYQSARREQSEGNIWLNANEAGDQQSISVNFEHLNRYPDFQPQALIQAYRDYCGVASESILATRGADEGIELIIRTFCRAERDSILICPPTYGMYAISAQAHNINIEKAPLIADMQLDLPVLASYKNRVKVVFICSPNNPTGNALAMGDIEQVLTLFADSALVVVDEAYIEFCPDKTVTHLLAAHPNLVVLRTLSKGFALAGLRCGFVLSSPAIIEQLSKVIAPYPISQPVAVIASQALCKREVMYQRVNDTLQLRDKTEAILKAQPWLTQLFASHSNYLLFRATNSQSLFRFLLDRGVVIRDQSKQLGLTDCLRVSIGNAEQMQHFFDALLAFNKVYYQQHNNLTRQDTL
ncbi:histidinol-phosphate transaminase [Thalassotalea ponticola]|uniref:histidinol-phosphate transaminase n=1 Tax=Thalassotalea ponticola TaxID=1523392 RepID=UPI0025B62544|nr:histidinol-phosphate transaminase [Thalassotalea ponticola]MDN3651301.1 histidinol-phosphate transaminase [Thalassotalea ponticola]